MATPDELANWYAGAWNEREPAKRPALLESACSPDIRFLQQGWEHEVRGVDELDATIAAFQADWPEGVDVRVELDDAGRLASRIRSRWFRLDLRRRPRVRDRLRRAR